MSTDTLTPPALAGFDEWLAAELDSGSGSAGYFDKLPLAKWV